MQLGPLEELDSSRRLTAWSSSMFTFLTAKTPRLEQQLWAHLNGQARSAGRNKCWMQMNLFMRTWQTLRMSVSLQSRWYRDSRVRFLQTNLSSSFVLFFFFFFADPSVLGLYDTFQPSSCPANCRRHISTELFFFFFGPHRSSSRFTVTVLFDVKPS